MKDFLAFFLLPMCASLFGLWMGIATGAEDKILVSDARLKCKEFLEVTNAPRNDYCVVFASYKIIKGEQK